MKIARAYLATCCNGRFSGKTLRSLKHSAERRSLDWSCAVSFREQVCLNNWVNNIGHYNSLVSGQRETYEEMQLKSLIICEEKG